jgi:hypothetical protein
VDAVVDRVAQERGSSLSRAALHDVRAREVRELHVRQHGDRALLDDRELLGRDLLPRLAEDVRVLETYVGQEDDV